MNKSCGKTPLSYVEKTAVSRFQRRQRWRLKLTMQTTCQEILQGVAGFSLKKRTRLVRCTKHARNNRAFLLKVCSAQQVGSVDDALRDLGQFQILVHCQPPQLLISLLLAQFVVFHQQAFGPFQQLTLRQLQLGVG
jgi:hypothetical protein